MNVKKICITAGIIVLFVLGLCFGAYQFGAKNARNSTGITGNTEQQRELLARIGEYEQRERDRLAAENSRIERERERIERTKAAIGAIRQSDRRSGDLLKELAEEIGILADYLDSNERELSSYRRDSADSNKTLEVREF
jgi:hypothetical protein